MTQPTGSTALPRKVSPLAVPLLGFFGAVQGSGPNIASTALVGASRSLDLTGSTQALAASMCSWISHPPTARGRPRRCATPW
jgi:hypothetical protein